MYKKNIDDLTLKILEYLRVRSEWKTITEVMMDNDIKHPQQLYSRLEKLIKWGYIDEDYNFIQWIDTPTIYFPFFGWAQCWNNGTTWRVDDYPMSKVDISKINTESIPAKDYKNYFITRAKWKSMEPEIKTGDNLLLKFHDWGNLSQSKSYLVTHNWKAKIKKVIPLDDWYALKSLNLSYPDMLVKESDSFDIIWEVDRKISI